MGSSTWRIYPILLLLIAASVPAHAEIVDRISIVVGNRAVKQSDIEREIRIVSFLNGAMPEFTVQSKKEVASRLIDQMLIRREIQTTDVIPASMSDAERLLEQVRRDRFPSETKFREALAQYGITEPQLKSALLWQLTVLRFITQRFGGAASASDRKVVDQQFEEWLEQARKDARIEYREDDLR